MLEKEFNDLAYKAFSVLPNKLTKENISGFVEACHKVSSLCRDPKLYRLLIPFHHLTFGWQSAYGEGFTWELFLKSILEDGCTDVECSMGYFGPILLFSDKDHSEINFRISVVHDD